jgi:hypothetical protein
MPGVGCFSHCAATGVASTDKTVARAKVFIFYLPRYGVSFREIIPNLQQGA